MRNAGWLILCQLMVFTATAAAQQGGFLWPGEREAAVSLTYDDGLDVHLDHAGSPTFSSPPWTAGASARTPIPA